MTSGKFCDLVSGESSNEFIVSLFLWMMFFCGKRTSGNEQKVWLKLKLQLGVFWPKRALPRRQVSNPGKPRNKPLLAV